MKIKGRPQSVNIEKAKGYKPTKKKSAKKLPKLVLKSIGVWVGKGARCVRVIKPARIE